MSHEITACRAKSGSWWKAQGAGPTGGRGRLGERAAAPWRGGEEEVSEYPVEAEDSTSKGHQAPALSDHDWSTDGLKEEEDEGLQDLMIANVKWRRPGLVVGFVSSAFPITLFIWSPHVTCIHNHPRANQSNTFVVKLCSMMGCRLQSRKITCFYGHLEFRTFSTEMIS